MLLIYLPHFPSESSRFFFDGAGMGQLLTLCERYNSACIGTVLSPGSWPVLSQSYCAGDRALYLGVLNFLMRHC